LLACLLAWLQRQRPGLFFAHVGKPAKALWPQVIGQTASFRTL